MEVVKHVEDPAVVGGKTKVVLDLHECPECGEISLERKRSHDAREADKDLCRECDYTKEYMPTG